MHQLQRVSRRRREWHRPARTRRPTGFPLQGRRPGPEGSPGRRAPARKTRRRSRRPVRWRVRQRSPAHHLPKRSGQQRRAQSPTSYDAARSLCVTRGLLRVVELGKDTGFRAQAQTPSLLRRSAEVPDSTCLRAVCRDVHARREDLGRRDREGCAMTRPDLPERPPADPNARRPVTWRPRWVLSALDYQHRC